MSILTLLQRARHEGWALGQFNTSALEVLQGIVDAANEAASPTIVGVSMGSLRHIGLAYLPGLVQGARAAVQVPLYFHLDHGSDFAAVKACIEAGFDSVMIDASRADLAENVRIVKEVVAFAHARGVGVEAQLGETWDEETGEQVESRTDPAMVGDFVATTGIDYLAISFGNTPGRMEGEAEVDVDLIRACAAASPVPLVLHGGSSIPEDALHQAIAAGAAKINIDTAIRRAITATLEHAYCTGASPHDPRKALQAMRQSVKEVVMYKMGTFGSAGRAR
jgi:fructose-bisphosphate aldolase class II